MKCPQCGYVSFDDLKECKKCGLTFETLEEAEEAAGESRFQKELFSLRLDDDEEEGWKAPEELPPLTLDEPASDAADPKERPQAEPSAALEPDTKVAKEAYPPPPDITFDPGADGEPLSPLAASSTRGEAAAAEAIIDDETLLPEDLWVEEGATFFTRLLAFAVDALILTALLSTFLAAALAVLRADGYTWSMLKTPEGLSALFVPMYLLGLFLSLSYFTFFVGWISRTPGKALLRLEICRTDGAPMSYTRSFLRWVGYLFSATVAGLGFLWIFFDERKRGWHDYLSGTWVKNLRCES